MKKYLLKKLINSLFISFILIFSFVGCKSDIHVHVFDDNWDYDSEYHFKRCKECNEISEQQGHELSSVILIIDETSELKDEGDCVICGNHVIKTHSHRYTQDLSCICGEQLSEVTVEFFLKLLGKNVEYITAYPSALKFSISDDGLSVNVWGLKLFGEFSTLASFPKNLKAADLSGIDTSSVTSMKAMFWNCSKLTEVNLSGINTSNVTDMNAVFYNCSNIVTLDLSSFDTSNVTTMNNMFRGCSKLTSLNIKSFNTSKVETMVTMFENIAVTTLNLSNFDTSNVTDMESMFAGCQYIKKLDLSHFDTSKVVDMGSMFYRCKSLEELDISNFDTSKVTNMANMFDECQVLSTLDLSNFNTSNVVMMQGMFRNTTLTEIKLQNFDTSKVRDMSYMFDHTDVTSLDLSNFNTENVETMRCMFNHCGVNKLDLSNFNTKNVKSMYKTFTESGLTELDISSFDTRNVTDFTDMFRRAHYLETIYVSPDFIINESLIDTIMFGGNSILVGAIEFDSNCLSAKFANYKIGYFKLKDTGKGFRYNFHDTVEKIDSIEVLLDTAEGQIRQDFDIVTFGDFPQTKKEASVEIDEEHFICIGYMTYYEGSDGYYYVKNKNEYFKVEPLCWRVLTTKYNDSDKALLLSEKSITANIPFYGNLNERQESGDTIYPNNYRYSQIRAFLNGQSTDTGKSWDGIGFLQTAFLKSGATLIQQTTVKNDKISTCEYNTDDNPATKFVCDDLIDYVFLLSLNEVTQPQYGFELGDECSEGNLRIKEPTDYAIATGADFDTEFLGGNWLLRSPSTSGKNDVRIIDSDGYGIDSDTVNHLDFGIVPAICVDYNL